MGREAFSPFLAWAGMCLSVVRQSYSPARTADRILLAAYAVEHQNGLFRWLCQAGFMRLFLFSRFFFLKFVYAYGPCGLNPPPSGLLPDRGFVLASPSSRFRSHFGGSHTLGRENKSHCLA